MFTCAYLCHVIKFSLSGMAEHLSTGHKHQYYKTMYGVIGPFESFVNTGMFPEQIAIIEMFSKFRNSRIAHAYKEQILQGT